MPQPADGPAQLPTVRGQLGYADTDTADDVWLTTCIDATNAWARSNVRKVLAVDGDTWPADIELGAVMLAARLARRRNSPDGVQAVTEAGVAFVARTDPDVALLLGLGSQAKPYTG